MTFNEALPPFVRRLFAGLGYTVTAFNEQHVIVTNNARKVDVYRDNKKSWNLLGSGLNVDIPNQADMAAMVIKNLEEI